MTEHKVVETLVLDATPLITQSASALKQYANHFYTTPGVKAELRDEHARNQFMLWGDLLVVRQPKEESVNRINAFAKLTGDYSVLSMNDVHIIALAYELEVEQNGEANLRQFPGQQLEKDKLNENDVAESHFRPSNQRILSENTEEEKRPEEEPEAEEDDGFQVVARKQRFSRKHYKQEWQKKKAQESMEQFKPDEPVSKDLEEQAEQLELTQKFQDTSISEQSNEVDNSPPQKAEEDDEDARERGEDGEDKEVENEDEDGENVYDEEDDDGEWITPDNLQETIMKDDNETVQDTNREQPLLVALSTGDFACQNTSMQLGLKLLNPQSGKQITKVRNYMYRCHACFHMLPMPKTGERKHFCPKCGGDTLLRCAVSVDTSTGKVTPHLKANFQWIRKGQVYSIASPLSKNSIKKQGNAGYQHNKENRHKALQDPVVLREDQKEYARAIKDDAWHRKKNEKMLAEWIGGGSADNFISPFQTSYRSAGVKVGRGRNANAVKKRK